MRLSLLLLLLFYFLVIIVIVVIVAGVIFVAVLPVVVSVEVPTVMLIVADARVDVSRHPRRAWFLAGGVVRPGVRM